MGRSRETSGRRLLYRLGLAAVVLTALLQACAGPTLEPWHTEWLHEEFTARADTLADVDIDAAAAAAVERLPPIDEVRNDLSVRRS